MTKPEMIIFDNGHTLLYEPDWDAGRGNREEHVWRESG